MNPITVAIIEAIFAQTQPGDLCRVGIVRGFLRQEYFDVVWRLCSTADISKRWSNP